MKVEPAPAHAVPYAGFVTRAIAIGIDIVLINAIATLIAAAIGLVLSAFGVQLSGEPATVVAGTVIWALVLTSYFVTFWVAVGQTPGMRLMQLKVVSTLGGRIKVRLAFRRLLGMVLSLLMLGIGFLLVLVSERRQGLHDKLAHTIVIYGGELEVTADLLATRTKVLAK